MPFALSLSRPVAAKVIVGYFYNAARQLNLMLDGSVAARSSGAWRSTATQSQAGSKTHDDDTDL